MTAGFMASILGTSSEMGVPTRRLLSSSIVFWTSLGVMASSITKVLFSTYPWSVTNTAVAVLGPMGINWIEMSFSLLTFGPRTPTARFVMFERISQEREMTSSTDCAFFSKTV